MSYVVDNESTDSSLRMRIPVLNLSQIFNDSRYCWAQQGQYLTIITTVSNKMLFVNDRVVLIYKTSVVRRYVPRPR